MQSTKAPCSACSRGHCAVKRTIKGPSASRIKWLLPSSAGSTRTPLLTPDSKHRQLGVCASPLGRQSGGNSCVPGTSSKQQESRCSCRISMRKQRKSFSEKTKRNQANLGEPGEAEQQDAARRCLRQEAHSRLPPALSSFASWPRESMQLQEGGNPWSGHHTY